MMHITLRVDAEKPIPDGPYPVEDIPVIITGLIRGQRRTLTAVGGDVEDGVLSLRLAVADSDRDELAALDLNAFRYVRTSRNRISAIAIEEA